jgi:hypothetical protein
VGGGGLMGDFSRFLLVGQLVDTGTQKSLRGGVFMNSRDEFAHIRVGCIKFASEEKITSRGNDCVCFDVSLEFLSSYFGLATGRFLDDELRLKLFLSCRAAADASTSCASILSNSRLDQFCPSTCIEMSSPRLEMESRRCMLAIEVGR